MQFFLPHRVGLLSHVWLVRTAFLGSALCSWLKQRPFAQAVVGIKAEETSDDPREQRISSEWQHADAPLHREGSVTPPPPQRHDVRTVPTQGSLGSLEPQRLRGSLSSRRQQQQTPGYQALAPKRWQQQPHPQSLRPEAAEANRRQLQKLPTWTLVSLSPPLFPQMLLPPLPQSGCALRTRPHQPPCTSVGQLGQQPRPRRPPPSRHGGRGPRPRCSPSLSPSPPDSLSQQPLQDRIASRAATASAAGSPRQHNHESKPQQAAVAGAAAVACAHATQHLDELPDQILPGMTRAGAQMHPIWVPDGVTVAGAAMACSDSQTQSNAAAAVAAPHVSASGVEAPAQPGSLPAEAKPVAGASGGSAVSGRIRGPPPRADASGVEAAGVPAGEQLQAPAVAAQAVAAEGSTLRGSTPQKVQDDSPAPAFPAPDRSPGSRLHCAGLHIEDPETAPGMSPSVQAPHHAAALGVVDRMEAVIQNLVGIDSKAPQPSSQRPSPLPPVPPHQPQRASSPPPAQRPRPAVIPLGGSRARAARPKAHSRTLFIERPSGHLAARLWRADDRYTGNFQLLITGCRMQTQLHIYMAVHCCSRLMACTIPHLGIAVRAPFGCSNAPTQAVFRMHPLEQHSHLLLELAILEHPYTC